MDVTDALGRALALRAAPQRIVSLVPSITETLFALGLDERVAGRTEFCVHPADRVARAACVGGTKNPDVDAIVKLRPDLVLANKEENRRRDVERLEAAGIPVFVTYSRSVREAVAEIRTLGRICERAEPAEAIARAVERKLGEVAVRGRARSRRPRVVALVWKGPYMAVGGDTFAHDLIVSCGGENCFSARDASAPGERRYPRVSAAEIEAARPDVILLPTEPYAFGAADRRELLGLRCPAAESGAVHVVEGELLSWYGPRMARALEEISALLL